MNNYELTVVLPGDVTPAKKKSVSEKIEKFVKEGKGKVTKVNEWGKIDLAYKIKKESSGVFIHYDIEMDGSVAKNMKDKLRLGGDIIRYLLVKKVNNK